MPDDEMGGRILSWTWGWLLKNKDLVKETVGEVREWFRGESSAGAGEEREPPRPGILILGPGGVGKTTLGRLLAGDYDYVFASPVGYAESQNVEIFNLPGDEGGRITVPPGQEHRRPTTWSRLLADLGGGQFRGVILLSGYGYHTLGSIRYRQHALYKMHRTKPKFLQAYLEDRRAEEMRILRDIKPHILANVDRMWLLTVVAKQDLWWGRREEVEEYYRGPGGGYAAEIRSIRDVKGAHAFHHEHACVSLVIRNFCTGFDELLKPNTAGYDHTSQVDSVLGLFRAVAELKRWEAE
jgi:hypothetical protein